MGKVLTKATYKKLATYVASYFNKQKPIVVDVRCYLQQTFKQYSIIKLDLSSGNKTASLTVSLFC